MADSADALAAVRVGHDLALRRVARVQGGDRGLHLHPCGSNLLEVSLEPTLERAERREAVIERGVVRVRLGDVAGERARRNGAPGSVDRAACRLGGGVAGGDCVRQAQDLALDRGQSQPRELP